MCLIWICPVHQHSFSSIWLERSCPSGISVMPWVIEIPRVPLKRRSGGLQYQSDGLIKPQRAGVFMSVWRVLSINQPSEGSHGHGLLQRVWCGITYLFPREWALSNPESQTLKMYGSDFSAATNPQCDSPCFWNTIDPHLAALSSCSPVSLCLDHLIRFPNNIFIAICPGGPCVYFQQTRGWGGAE